MNVLVIQIWNFLEQEIWASIGCVHYNSYVHVCIYVYLSLIDTCHTHLQSLKVLLSTATPVNLKQIHESQTSPKFQIFLSFTACTSQSPSCHPSLFFFFFLPPIVAPLLPVVRASAKAPVLIFGRGAPRIVRPSGVRVIPEITLVNPSSSTWRVQLPQRRWLMDEM